MGVIIVRANFHIAYLVPLLELQTHGLEGLGDRFGEYGSSVLDGTDDVVQHQVLIVTFDDVFRHPLSYHLRPRSRAARQSLRV